MTGVQLGCQFCGDKGRTRPLEQLALAVGLYLAHLIESHWPVLVELHRTRETEGPPNDAWKRL